MYTRVWQYEVVAGREASEDAFRRLLEQRAGSYAELDRQSEVLTQSEQEIATGLQS